MGEHVDDAIAYLQGNPLVAWAVGLVLLYLLVRKTRVFVLLLLLTVVLGMVLHLIADLAGIGGAAKKKLIDQTTARDVM